MPQLGQLTYTWAIVSTQLITFFWSMATYLKIIEGTKKFNIF